MGISTYQSYCGAQIFDAIGLSSDFLNQYFTGTATTIEGAGLYEIAQETMRWHHQAYGNNPIYDKHLNVGGDYAVRERGERHAGLLTPLLNYSMQFVATTGKPTKNLPPP